MSDIWRATYKHSQYPCIDIEAKSAKQAAWQFFDMADQDCDSLPRPDMFYKGIIVVWQDREEDDMREMYNVTDFEIDIMCSEVNEARRKFIAGMCK